MLQIVLVNILLCLQRISSKVTQENSPIKRNLKLHTNQYRINYHLHINNLTNITFILTFGMLTLILINLINFTNNHLNILKALHLILTTLLNKLNRCHHVHTIIHHLLVVILPLPLLRHLHLLNQSKPYPCTITIPPPNKFNRTRNYTSTPLSLYTATGYRWITQA
eukprot:TRINITY_DN6856_c0_g1_i3.p1 TRINITY_DN6856_c0_g1~~TRINITY_DN6856_c0_g1_i3.p1  ORF type:complete len:166 (+),score=18.52 TRINITY_DN6856_c0_g1_i3:438-935(+)